MQVLLLGLSHLARAGAGVPLDTVPAADLVFRGTVANISECMSADGFQPSTFVQFVVQEEIVGNAVPSTTEPANRFTVRLPAGHQTDGSYSGPVGMPNLQVGDKLIVPVFASDGSPGFLPFFMQGDGAWQRVFPDIQGGVVVTPDGFILQLGRFDQPVPGPQLVPLRHNYPSDILVDNVAAADAIANYRGIVGFDGVNPPLGPWAGHLRIKSTLPIYLTEPEISVATEGDCNAQLTGEFDGTVLTLNGWCNAPKIGRLDITIYGEYDGDTGWSGYQHVESSYDADFAGNFLWSDAPWSSSFDFPDAFSAHTTASQAAGSVPSQFLQLFTLGEDPKRNIDFAATWVGYRDPITVAEYQEWIAANALAQENTGRDVYSTPNLPENCVSLALGVVSE